MKLKRTIALTLGMLAAGALQAQTDSTSTNSNAGLLGQRYAEFGFGIHDIKFASDNAYSLGTSANFPVLPSHLDLGASYSYDWIGGPQKTHSNTIGGYATAYANTNGVKPFVGAGLAWHTNGFGAGDEGLWGATTGLEIPVGDLTLTPRANYTDDFQVTGVSSQQLSWSLEGDCAVSPKSSVFAAAGRTDVLHSDARSWDYQLGVRVKF